MPVVPATQEAEVGGSPEPGSSRLQWAMIALLHSSLSNRAWRSEKKTQTTKNKPKKKNEEEKERKKVEEEEEEKKEKDKKKEE